MLRVPCNSVAIDKEESHEDGNEFAEEIEGLENELADLYAEKKCINGEIVDLLESNADLPKQMNLILNRMKTQLAFVESDTSQLSSMLSLTSVLAENISGKVRELDTAKSRVVDCLQRVEDILDLRFCTEGVQTALQHEDYEQAAGLIHRFLALDETFTGCLGADATEDLQAPLEGVDGGTGQPVSSLHDDDNEMSLQQSCEILRKAERELGAIVTAKFDEAVAENDVASMERFFKLFPLLNKHKEGLTRYATYLRSKVAEAAETNYAVMKAGGSDDSRVNVLYADTLTLLFEGVARVIEIHQPLIETYYGADRLFTVVEVLQKECDYQAKRILDRFFDHRQFSEKVRLVQVQARSGGGAGFAGTTGMTKSASVADMRRLDPMELDTVLAEVTLMHTRAELYLRFIRRRLSQSLDPSASPSPIRQLDVAQPAKDQALKRESIEKFLSGCELRRIMQELIGQYIAMEEYFMRECVIKALTMDASQDAANAALAENTSSSLVDDVFFVVRKCVRRSLTSSNVDCVCAMLNYASSVLETEYFTALQSRLKAGYPSTGSFAEAAASAAAAYTSVMQQGKIPSSGTEGGERARFEFLRALNDMDHSVNAIDALRESLGVDIEKHIGDGGSSVASGGQTVVSPDAKAQHSVGRGKVESCLTSLADIGSTFKQATRIGVEQLVASAAKPRLKSWIDAYLDVTHAPTESEFLDFEANDPFMAQLLTNVDELLSSFRESLAEANYIKFLEETCQEISRRLEKVFLRVTFNRLGCLQLDREIRELVGYMTSITSWSVRERFARLTQIASLLNVEAVSEVKEMFSVGGAMITWRLTPNEVRQFLALRVDLPGEEIRRLRL